MSAQRVTQAEGHARKALEKKEMAHTISIVVVLVVCRLRGIIECRITSVRDVGPPMAIMNTMPERWDSWGEDLLVESHSSSSDWHNYDLCDSRNMLLH